MALIGFDVPCLCKVLHTYTLVQQEGIGMGTFRFVEQYHIVDDVQTIDVSLV